METKIIPRFKSGQEIEYNPALTWKPRKKPRPTWIVGFVDEDGQAYHLSRLNGKQKRVLFFKRQRRYRVANLPYEEQPPMWPKPGDI